MRLAGKLLRGFRTYLGRTYCKDDEGNFVDAEFPSKYASLISPQEWVKFKAKRQTEEFQRLSAINRERTSAPQYKYRKGRVGYGRLEQSLLQKANSSETSLPAHVLWKEARVGKSGVAAEEVLQVYEKCEALSQSVSADDTRSILSRALDVPEYPGRVRGKAFGITPTSLNIKKGKAASNAEIFAKLEALEAEVRELRKEKERDNASGVRDGSEKDSINCSFHPIIPEGIHQCQLFLSSPTRRMVAKGKVHNNGVQLLHNKSLPTGSLKVSVDIAIEEEAPLPYPNDDSEVTLVREAIGSYVAWPSSLVLVGYETPTKSKTKDKRIPEHTESVVSKNELPGKALSKASTQKNVGAKNTRVRKQPIDKVRSCLQTFLPLMTDIPTGGVRLITMEKGLYGFEFEQNVGNEDFEQVFQHSELGVTVVNIYLRFLYDNVMRPRGLEQRFAFLCPSAVNLTLILTKPDEVHAYIRNVFMDNQTTEKLFFLPFNTGGHWLLVAINPIRGVVYYLDSLGNDWATYPDMKDCIDTAIQAFLALRDSHQPQRRINPTITWNYVKCPRQRNDIDCGYFMLRFMRDTLSLDRMEIPPDYFEEFRSATYSKAQLDEIKEEWCQYIMGLGILQQA